MSECLIREATLADAKSIAEIHVAAWRSAYRGLIPDQELATLSVFDREAFWQERLGQGRTSALVCVEGANVVGWSVAGLPRDAGCDLRATRELYGLYLFETHWGRGYGRMLLEQTEDRMSAAGADRIMLWVLARNDRARRFYERAGYAAVSGAEKPWHFREITLIISCYQKSL